MNRVEPRTATTSIDPITVEVIGSALSSIAEEMGEALVRASHSTNIKERRDCSTALFDVHANTLCQAEHIPMHLSSFLEMVPTILRDYPVTEMRPGDVFIGNDAYEGGGTHLPDVVLAEPIFMQQDGQSRMVAWAVNTAHHSDFADRGHAHIYQEGLRIPLVRLYRAGVLQADVQKLILLNCQVPRERLSDLRAQMAANRRGVQRFQALCAKYGTDVVLAAGDALQDYAERKMRAGIAAIPDGTYRFADLLDNPEIAADMPISVEVTVAGDEMRLRFESPPQVRAGFNMTYTALLASVYYSIKSIVDPTILPNAGLARPITVSADPGTVFRCVSPAAVNWRVQSCQRAVDLIFGALAQAVPERVMAGCNADCFSMIFAGDRPEDGSTWIYTETTAGGAGARASKDGLDGVHVHLTNTSNLSIEALEREYPLSVERYELVQNSGGAGKFRGGMSVRRLYRAERDCRLEFAATRLRTAPWGMLGGLQGGSARIEYGPDVQPFVGGEGEIKRGQWFAAVTPGAGGYGPPAERDRAAIRADVEEGVIDRDTALRVYGYAGG